METILMSIDGWIKIVWYIGKTREGKRGWGREDPTIFYNISKSGSYYTKWNKVDTEWSILWVQFLC